MLSYKCSSGHMSLAMRTSTSVRPSIRHVRVFASLMSDRSYLQVRLPWWGKHESVEYFHAGIDTAKQQLAEHPAIIDYAKRSLTGYSIMANKLEGTFPAGLTDEIAYQLMDAVCSQPLSLDTACPEPVVTWPAEGASQQQPPSTAESSKQQLIQFAKASEYLMHQQSLDLPLTTGIICTAHEILMCGAVDEDGSVIASGKYRSCPSHSGTGYTYPDPAAIPELLQSVVNRYNTKFQAGEDMYSLAAYLLYHTVIVHPFENGNGRLCRLLAAYAASAAGHPFVLDLNNGRKKCRQHYQQVLRHADMHCQDLSRLECFMLECSHRQWKDALAYAGAASRFDAATGL